ADHHPYSAADARALIAAARATDAELVTTAKDWVRCPPDLRAASAVLEIDLTWAAGDNILAWLESRLEGAEP
ncbi:MAG: tetraacyldisaccharide 4'-kinase, partial [Pseudomonadota bacterium]|nr:tetraacyldisaccharide 4'-kinase [Pseudomonadota bacterium]